MSEQYSTFGTFLIFLLFSTVAVLSAIVVLHGPQTPPPDEMPFVGMTASIIVAIGYITILAIVDYYVWNVKK